MAQVHMVKADQLSAAAGHLTRNWGDYGYTLGVEAAGSWRAIFLAHHSDGSEFRFMVDGYGNVTDLPDAPDYVKALELLPS